jgi:hypothetical protein
MFLFSLLFNKWSRWWLLYCVTKHLIDIKGLSIWTLSKLFRLNLLFPFLLCILTYFFSIQLFWWRKMFYWLDLSFVSLLWPYSYKNKEWEQYNHCFGYPLTCDCDMICLCHICWQEELHFSSNQACYNDFEVSHQEEAQPHVRANIWSRCKNLFLLLQAAADL